MAYFICDIDSGGGHNYSTDEQKIGTWIDGKTLYERTFYSTTKFGSGDTALVLNNQIPSNIDVIDIKTQLNIEARDGGKVYKFATTSAGWFAAYYDISNNTFYAKQTLSIVSHVTDSLIYIILRYTKTS